MSRKESVFWTYTEKAAVIKAAHQLVLDRKMALPFGRGLLVSTVKEAQEIALPKNRHKNVAAATAFSWVEEGVMDLITTPPTEQAPTQAVLVESKKVELEDLIADSLASLFIDSDLGRRLVGKVTERIKSQALVEATKALPPAAVKEEPVEKTFVQEVTPNKTLPTLVIAGGDKRLFTIIETEFDGILKMKFFESEELKKSNLRNRLGLHDKVLICTDYINHAATHCVKNATEKWEVKGGRQPGPILEKIRTIFKLDEKKAVA